MDIEWLKSNVFPYVNLLIFVFLIVKFGKKPLQSMLHDRRNQFVKSRDEAAKLFNEAKIANDQLETRYSALQTELAEIRREALKAAEWEGEQAISRAKQLAQTILSDAQVQIDTMAKDAGNRIREHLILEVSELAASSLQKQITDNPMASAKFVEENIRQAGHRAGELSQ